MSEYSHVIKVCWRNWMDGLPEYVITKEMKYSDIIIPTMDTTRLNFLLEHLLTNNKTVRKKFPVNWIISVCNVFYFTEYFCHWFFVILKTKMDIMNTI